MERRNIDLGIPLTRDEWLQVGSAADMQPDDGVLEWTPNEFDVTHVSLRGSDAPKGWEDVVPADEREVARFVFNEGRPMAQLTPPPSQPRPPAITAKQERDLEVELEHWVRDKWQLLADCAGLRE